MSEIRSANASAVTVVTQTRVEPSFAEGFARWQRQISEAVATSTGIYKRNGHAAKPSRSGRLGHPPALREH